MTHPFSIEPVWAEVLSELGIRPAELLRQAGLPEDLFARVRPTLEAEAFAQLWSALSARAELKAPGLVLGQAISLAARPQVLAGLCSPNLVAAIDRMAMYASLSGPVKFEVHDTQGGLEVVVGAQDMRLPPEFILSKFVFLVEIAWKALGPKFRPLAIEMSEPPKSSRYRDFFNRPVRPGPFNRIVISRSDARTPFVPVRGEIFSDFDPDLRPRLDELEADAPIADRVRTVLMEGLPSGRGETAEVAERLGISVRSMQRRLAKDGTSFKFELQSLRTRLARHYLSDIAHSGTEIAFLLGYDDPNSFIRAFHGWTGTSPEAMRRKLICKGSG